MPTTSAFQGMQARTLQGGESKVYGEPPPEIPPSNTIADATVLKLIAKHPPPARRTVCRGMALTA